MADEPHPGFPPDETIFVVTVPLQLVEGGSVNARYVAAASTTERAAQESAYGQWQEHYPNYLAGQPHVWKVRRLLPAKSGLFWGGFFSGFVAFPAAIIAIALVVGFFQRAASADTHPKGGDVQQAPLVSGAVANGETPNLGSATQSGEG